MKIKTSTPKEPEQNEQDSDPTAAHSTVIDVNGPPRPEVPADDHHRQRQTTTLQLPENITTPTTPETVTQGALARYIARLPQHIFLHWSAEHFFSLIFMASDSAAAGYNKAMGPAIEKIANEAAPAKIEVAPMGINGIFYQNRSFLKQLELLGITGVMICTNGALIFMANKLHKRLTRNMSSEASTWKTLALKLSAIVPGMMITGMVNASLMHFLLQPTGIELADQFLDKNNGTTTDKLPALIHFNTFMGDNPLLLATVQTLACSIAFPALRHALFRGFIKVFLKLPKFFRDRTEHARKMSIEGAGQRSKFIRSIVTSIFLYDSYRQAFNTHYLDLTGAYYLEDSDFLAKRQFMLLFYNPQELILCFLTMFTFSEGVNFVSDMLISNEELSAFQKVLKTLLPTILFMAMLYLVDFGIDAMATDDATTAAYANEAGLMFDIQSYLPVPIPLVVALFSLISDASYLAIPFIRQLFCSSTTTTAQDLEDRPLLNVLGEEDENNHSPTYGSIHCNHDGR